MACHRRIEQRLDTLVTAGDHLANDREPALAAIAKSIAFLDSNGAMHTEDEESSLFPRLRPKLSVEELAYVDSLEQQHSEAEGIYAELKELVALGSVASYRDCASRLRDLYRRHIQSEDQILTALARRLLSEKELAAITVEMRARRSTD